MSEGSGDGLGGGVVERGRQTRLIDGLRVSTEAIREPAFARPRFVGAGGSGGMPRDEPRFELADGQGAGDGTMRERGLEAGEQAGSEGGGAFVVGIEEEQDAADIAAVDDVGFRDRRESFEFVRFDDPLALGADGTGHVDGGIEASEEQRQRCDLAVPLDDGSQGESDHAGASKRDPCPLA